MRRTDLSADVDTGAIGQLGIEQGDIWRGGRDAT
jgi:hypothetical protein